MFRGTLSQRIDRGEGMRRRVGERPSSYGRMSACSRGKNWARTNTKKACGQGGRRLR